LQVTPETTLPVRRDYRLIGIAVVVIFLALIEIQFAADSFRFVYQTMRDHLGPLDTFWGTAEQWAETTTSVVIVITVWILRPFQRHALVAFLATILISSTLVNVTKAITGRARPNHGIRIEKEDGARGLAFVRGWLVSHPDASRIMQPKAGDYWLWLDKDRPWFAEEVGADGKKSTRNKLGDYGSFPSGHACAAFVVAYFMTYLMPKAGWVWYLLAFGAAMARVRFRRHYPGDVMVGAAIGVIVSHLIFSSRWPVVVAGWFPKLLGPIPERKDSV